MRRDKSSDNTNARFFDALESRVLMSGSGITDGMAYTLMVSEMAIDTEPVASQAVMADGTSNTAMFAEAYGPSSADARGLYDPSTNKWYLPDTDNASAQDVQPFAYGAAGWIPVVGDSNGEGGGANDRPKQFDPTDLIPGVGDWDGVSPDVDNTPKHQADFRHEGLARDAQGVTFSSVRRLNHGHRTSQGNEPTGYKLVETEPAQVSSYQTGGSAGFVDLSVVPGIGYTGSE